MSLASRSTVVFAFAWALGAGCTPSAPTGSSGSTASTVSAASSAPPSSEGGVRPDEGGPPEPVGVHILAKLCAEAPCSNERARVRVFYRKNAIHRYAHDGDLRTCSHPPTFVFDGTGTKLGSIPEEPLSRGSAREKEMEAQKAALFDGSKHLVTYDCAGKWIGKGTME